MDQQHSSSSDSQNQASDVYKVVTQGREFILIGTAHVSQESADLVQTVISQEAPDSVCVELDERRYTALSQQRRWEDLDLKDVIRQRQLSPLIAGLVLSAYQKKLGGQLGVMPGAELLEAIQVAKRPPLSVFRPVVPRLWCPETPESPAQPILSGMSRSRIAAPCLAASRYGKQRLPAEDVGMSQGRLG